VEIAGGAQALEDVIGYAMDSKKTEQPEVAGGAGNYRYQILLRRQVPKTQRLSPLMREECRKLNDITRQMRLLHTNKIDSLPQLERYRESLAAKASLPERQRKALYNKAAKLNGIDTIKDAREQISIINDQLKFLRRQLLPAVTGR
jgi:hypothetical protein